MLLDIQSLSIRAKAGMSMILWNLLFELSDCYFEAFLTGV
jgi:hypothetical protein